MIVGYGPDIDPSAAGLGVLAFTTLAISQGSHQPCGGPSAHDSRDPRDPHRHRIGRSAGAHRCPLERSPAPHLAARGVVARCQSHRDATCPQQHGAANGRRSGCRRQLTGASAASAEFGAEVAVGHGPANAVFVRRLDRHDRPVDAHIGVERRLFGSPCPEGTDAAASAGQLVRWWQSVSVSGFGRFEIQRVDPV